MLEILFGRQKPNFAWLRNSTNYFSFKQEASRPDSSAV